MLIPGRAVLVHVVEYDPIRLSSGPPIHLRLEVFKSESADRFYANVYRRDTFRIKPAFFECEADHEMFVIDDFLDGLSLHGEDISAIVAMFETKVSEALL